jgi:hypothetical protein
MWMLYKEFDEAVDEQPLLAEYYQVIVVTKHEVSGPFYVVEQNHGWWSEEEGLPKLHITVLSTEDGFPKFQDAMALVRTQMRYLVSIGFLHQLTFDPFAERSYVHKVLSEKDFGETDGVMRPPSSH